MPERKFRTIATFVQGDAVGVVVEPVIPGGVPKERRADLWVVKIGLVGGKSRRSAPYPAGAFEGVVRELRAFLRQEGVT